MTELTPEQLALIRARDEALFLDGEEGVGFAGKDRRALLAHIDHQAARIAELEKEIHRTRHPLLSGFVEDARVEHAAKAAWPAFKSGLEGANWAQAPQLRKDRLRIIVRTALTAALTQPEQPEAGREDNAEAVRLLRELRDAARAYWDGGMVGVAEKRDRFRLALRAADAYIADAQHGGRGDE